MNLPQTEWLASLKLQPHATILHRLLAELEAQPSFRFLELGCSVARGAGDELSDLDLALGVADEEWQDALLMVPTLLTRLGDLVDLLEHRIAGWSERRHRRFFAQYRNGVQVDLVAIPVSLRPGMPVDSVALYDPDRRLANRLTSSLEMANADNVREWAFLGWIALANLDKYLRRGSAWEALEQLHEARTQLWRLWAVVAGARYPTFGLTSALDKCPSTTPPGLDQTVATTEIRSLRRAGRALAAMLGPISARAAGSVGAQLPHGMEDYISKRLLQSE